MRARPFSFNPAGPGAVGAWSAGARPVQLDYHLHDLAAAGSSAGASRRTTTRAPALGCGPRWPPSALTSLSHATIPYRAPPACTAVQPMAEVKPPAADVNVAR